MIKRLKVKNWMSFKEKEVIFKSGINLILGENGAGKSNLIEAIYFGLYGDTTKGLKLTELVNYEEQDRTFKINLEVNDIYISRDLISELDFLKRGDNILAKKREGVNKWINNYFLDKKIFDLLVYNSQFRITDFIDTSPAEKEKMLNTIFKIDKLLELDNLFRDLNKEISFMINEYTLNVGRLLNFKQSKIAELNKRLEELYNEISSKEKEIEWLKKNIELISYHIEYLEKILAINKALQLRRKINTIRQEIKLFEENKKLFIELISKLNFLKDKEKELINKISKIEKLKKEGKCFYCERELQKIDYENYNRELIKLNNELNLIQETMESYNSQIKDIQKILANLEKKLVKVTFNSLLSEYIKLKNFILSSTPLKVLKEKLKGRELNLDLDNLRKECEDFKKDLDKTEKALIELKIEKEQLTKYIEKDIKENIEEEIKKLNEKINRLKEIKEQIEIFRELNKKGIFSRAIKKEILKYFPLSELFKIFKLGNLMITEDFDLLLNGINLKAGSGGQKVIANILMKILFLQLYKVSFIILDEPTVYLDKERRELLAEFFNQIKIFSLIPQFIIVTHDHTLEKIADHIIIIEKE